MERWRLIFDSPQNGAANMATDQAIMEAVGTGQVLPTLRFYAWEPACLSLGYNQASNEADLEQLAMRGWEIVRRATGGKAILHTDEVTYSVALPNDSSLAAGSILDSYRRLSEALLLGLSRLDIPVQSTAKDEAGRADGPVCFEVPSNYEITANGHKLVGSAQLRRSRAMLQHGSVPLTGDITRICDVLVFEDEAAREQARERVHQRATTVERVIGEILSWNTVAHALVDAFADTFNIDFVPEQLTPQEIERRDALCQDTYRHDAWTHRR